MALFISYSSQDRSTVDALTNALRKGQQQVWFDQELGGGESWWNKILEQVRSCDVFIVALSNNWLQSKPSQAELRYAQALNRPILPVRIGDIDSMRVNPLAALQIIDYREPSVDAGIQLVTAVHALQSKPVPLPEPLPEEPPVPFGYITRLGNTLAEKELSPQQQTQLLIELRSGLDEDGDDPSARSDIAQLLRMLRLRHDITYRNRTEIDNVLAEIEAKNSGSEGGATTAAAEAQPAAVAAPTQPSRPATGAASGAGAPAGKSNKRLMIIGGAAVAVIAAIAVVVVLTTQGTSKKSSAPAGDHPQTGAAAPPGRLDAILLGPPEVATIMGLPSIEIKDQTQQLRPPSGSLSNLECLGAFEPIEESVYTGSASRAVRGQLLRTSDYDFRVQQAAVAFPNAEKAQAFVTASADKWKACANKSVTMTTDRDRVFRWTFGSVAGAPPTISQLRTPADPARPSCQRVLSAVSDVVLDVEACAVGATDQASRLTQKMTAKVQA
ncbi:MAG: sensor domain-containing protein [Mycobacterium sp.]|uniref:sensor domain-containing protein n=1 Tax=Mycobacterium sp. TaxID=1785 RepID=UPI001EC29198|nr:sensor domain-containing protein [Mycobacterium sp.]MBV8789930.1 sensor domain-containing protein [Mycobacterium sp.]